MVFNNSVPLCSLNEPKIKEIVCEKAETLPLQTSNLKFSPPMNTVSASDFDDLIDQRFNSNPENYDPKLDKTSINPEYKTECFSDSKPTIISRKSPTKPVISKVKANSKEKPNYCSIIYMNSTTPDVKSLNDKPLPLSSNDVATSVKEQSDICSKIDCSSGKKLLQDEPPKKTEYKRLPLKENKVVGNKSKPCKDNKKNTVANISHPKLMYEITSQDGVSICSHDVEEAWQKIFDAVQEGRAKKRLPPLPQNSHKSHLRLLGLGNNSVKFLLEQLPGVKSCKKYRPVYHKTKLFGHSDLLRENPTGCARTEPISNKKRKYDMFSWLASRHRRPPKLIVNSETEIINGISRRGTNTSLPMAMRFRHLKETSKEAVGVFRSDIHGRGLFCLRDIDGGEMVIEYAGEVIRAGLTDKREHYYTAKGIGCYMFRIDDQFVVDATMHGNAARFINHSCEPNCFSKVVDILGKKHILIFALRKITQGEELTYDYKFPLEDEKISCHCLSRKCRKYLN